jgi:large subunit ribosomal protein L9
MARVILRSDVKGLGKRGDVIEVADGYARNYLFPKKAALPASEGSVAQAAAMRRARDLRHAKDRESAQTIASTLVAKTITIVAKARGEKLFGSVAEKDIVDAVKAQTGVELDRRNLHMADHIKSTGSHEVPVRLPGDVEFRIQVEVSAS